MTLKTSFLKIAVVASFCLSIIGCNPKKAMEDKMGEMIGEKILESAGIEAENVTNSEEQITTISINYDGNEMVNVEKGFGSIQLTSELVAMTFRDEEGTFNILTGLSMDPSKLKNAPLDIEMIKGSNTDKKDNFTFTMTMSDGIYVVAEGTAKIEEFSKERFAMTIKGKGGKNSADTHNGVGLKDVVVEIVSENPPYLFMGVEKDNVL